MRSTATATATTLSLLSLAPALLASPVERCTGTISTLDDVAAAIKCTTVRSVQAYALIVVI
jgi:hypothetical protein